MSAHRYRRCRAFTMIELMFVVTILGILLVVAVPRMSGAGSRTALEATGRDMARLCEYARRSAIAGQKPVTVTFDPERQAWWLELEPEKAKERFKPRTRARGGAAVNEFEEPRTLHSRLHFKEFLRNGEALRGGEPAVVTFYPSGSSSGLSVLLENNAGRVMTIEIERATGRGSAYLGEPVTLAERLHAAGIDATRYGGTTAAAAAPKKEDRFYRSAGSSEERIRFYEDAAARIMSQSAARHERRTAAEENERVLQRRESGEPDKKGRPAGKSAP